MLPDGAGVGGSLQVPLLCHPTEGTAVVVWKTDLSPAQGRTVKCTQRSVILAFFHWLRLNYDVPTKLQPRQLAWGCATRERSVLLRRFVISGTDSAAKHGVL
jgi:hypothetical protein